MGDFDNLLLNIFIFLLAGLLAVPTATRLGLGPVFGYLSAGIIVGPWGLAMIRDVSHIELFSRLATILLLFLVALQATPDRVKRLLSGDLAISLFQYTLTTLVIMAVGILIGYPWYHMLVAGLALAMSSEAVASHAFRERYPAGAPVTETGYQLLLTHTMLMIPVIIMLPVFGFQAELSLPAVGFEVFKGVALVILFGVFGHLLLRQAFRYVVDTGLDEVFAAFALLLVIGVLLMVYALDLPLEIGALLSGFLLTRSEYGSAIRIAMYPFTGLLVGMFFITTGMQIDFATFTRKPLETFALVALLVVIKAAMVRNVLRYSNVPRQQRIWLATVLAQSGELAFVVIALGITYQAIPDRLAAQLVLVVALSMLTTPVLLFFAARRGELPPRQQLDTGVDKRAGAETQVIVAGFGRVGRTVASLLKENGFRTVVVDHNPARFSQLRNEGFAGFYGNALRPDLLDAAGAANASALVIAINDPQGVVELVKRARRDYPHIKVFSRAFDRDDEVRLHETGAERAYAETFETALLMSEDVLEQVGVSPLDAQVMIERYRDAGASTPAILSQADSR